MQRPPSALVALTMACLLAVGGAPAGATTPPTAPVAPRVVPTVTLQAEPATVTKGGTVTFAGTVSGPSRGARVRLEVRFSGFWKAARKSTVRSGGRYRMERRIYNVKDRYRVVVLGNARVGRAVSPVVIVRSTPRPAPPLSEKDLGRLRYKLAELIDQYRRDNGRRRVSTRIALHDYAQQWSEAQAKTGVLSARESFSDEPEDYDVTAELVTLAGHPKAVFASLVEQSAGSLLAGAKYLGIGMALRDDHTGYWTVDLAVDEPPKVWTEEEVRQLILDETNAYRAEYDLPPLVLMPELNTVAQNWSRHMAEEDDLRHNPDWYSQYPPGATGGGENIAGGYDPSDVVRAWMASPGHRGNILGDGLTHIGIGYATNDDSTYTRYYTQNFARY